MNLRQYPLGPLQEAVPAGRLFADWLAGRLEADFLDPAYKAADKELIRARTSGSGPREIGSGPSPLFASSWVSGWSESILEDLDQAEDRARFLSQVTEIQAGRAEVVVTGQQPGFMGGPLYTLFKVATAVALARDRTAAGRPTYPVFWSGDDDDDLTEALGPVAWDPASGLTGGEPVSLGARTGRSPMLGRLTADPWGVFTARWLDRVSAGDEIQTDDLPADLANIWRQAVAGNWPWSRLARRSLLRVFTGTGLMVVSGDDPQLHAAAGPLYERILARPDHLADLAARRGQELDADRWHAQISARSLANSMFVARADRRVAWEAGKGDSDPANLRPGVMLRSPVQDWLLQPAAVVVGPGELAYLRQLDPLYEELGIVRSPLVPRLFAWLLPPGFDTERLRSFKERSDGDPGLAARLADQAEQDASRNLTTILRDELGVEPSRAVSLAKGRARRWRKGVAAMLGDEIRRSALQQAPSRPAWVFPAGKRQERHLGYLCATALWGGALVDACVQAAGRHLELGARSDWREFAIEVPEP